MASSKEYLDSVLDQLSLAGGLARNREKALRTRSLADTYETESHRIRQGET